MIFGNIFKRFWVSLSLLTLCGLVLCGCTERKDLETALYAVVLENLRAATEEDIDAYVDTMHSDAPTYQQTQQLTKQVFATHDLKYETHVFRYVEQDGDYAIARLEFSTTRIAGPEFKDNRLDTFHIFCKENGQWKIWSQVTLTVKYL
ncbi:hypothetical protein F4X73_13030 [Candidatus Poribacteria bacterium]|nr:hypothetical protein [Candidatus Poribacteria bacterium]